ncbi:MAG TPA: ZIP family metal transporter [Candidatus Limnocylindrales bacterium]|nr:ZIP family metal transporter [Candidatus Limnocylindrales bacterium]
MIPLAALLPFFSTLAGGMAALRFHHRLHPFMAFAAGVLVATAVADLLPEASELIGDRPIEVGIAFLVGYLLLAFIESFIHQQSFEHGYVDHDHGPDRAAHGHRRAPFGSEPPIRAGRSIFGLLAPASLIIHSTLDGFAIGVAFQAGAGLGLIVLLAVLAHDFADGMNVVTLALDAARGRGLAIGFLVLDALAPVIGAGLSLVVVIPDVALGWLLAGFSGVFIAIGASHLLPESQHGHATRGPALIGLTAVGAVLVLVVRSIAE